MITISALRHDTRGDWGYTELARNLRFGRAELRESWQFIPYRPNARDCVLIEGLLARRLGRRDDLT